jgi:isocitrate lyase
LVNDLTSIPNYVFISGWMVSEVKKSHEEQPGKDPI